MTPLQYRLFDIFNDIFLKLKTLVCRPAKGAWIATSVSALRNKDTVICRLTYCTVRCIMNYNLLKKGVRNSTVDDTDSSGADRSSINCQLNTLLFIGITCVYHSDSRLCLFCFFSLIIAERRSEYKLSKKGVIDPLWIDTNRRLGMR